MYITELETVLDILKPMDVLEFRLKNVNHRFVFLIKVGSNYVFSDDTILYEISSLREMFDGDDLDISILRSEEILKQNTFPFDDITDNLDNDKFIECHFSDVFRSNKKDKELNLEDFLDNINESILNLVNGELMKRGISLHFKLQTDIINKNQIKSTLIKR